MSRSQLQVWGVAVAVGLTVAFLGAWEATSGFSEFWEWNRDRLLVALALAVAVASYRLLPALGLAVVWALLLAHLLGPVQVMKVEVAVAVLAYGLGRYARWTTVVAAAASIPTAALVALWARAADPGGLVVGGGNVDEFYLTITGTGSASEATRALALLAFVVLAVPWLVGLLLRAVGRGTALRAEKESAEQARESAEEARATAEEVARLRATQAQLARDVHDVVGHSLAVILAQAESAQFLPDDDPARVRATLANIATSARESLQEVRRVLTATRAGQAVVVVPEGGLDALVEGVRAAGNDVWSEVLGQPRPLPPELDVVAFRVLQEMLTNALKHGPRGSVVHVERHWQSDLRIEVRNEVAPGTDSEEGHGVEGMRRRLESVGGRLDLRRRAHPDGTATFTATAWVPTGAAEVRA